MTINTKAGSPYKTLAEVIEASKSGQINMGISNFGSDDHIMMLRFMKLAGANSPSSRSPTPLRRAMP